MNITGLIFHESGDIAFIHAKSSGAPAIRTFTELGTEVGRLAAALQRSGIVGTDRILILAGNRIETLSAILAAFHLGAVAVPVSPLLGTAATVAIIDTLQPTCCVFDDALRPEVESALLRRGSISIRLRPQTRSPDISIFHRDPGDSQRSLPPACEVIDDHPALIMHSSGSEGRPKAITLSHGELRTFIEHNAQHYEQYIPAEAAGDAAGPYVCVLPLSHLGGLGICLQGLLTARTVCLLSYFLPTAFLKLIEQQRCSLISLVPSMYRSLLEDPYLPEADLSSLRFCLTLGEACSAELVQRIESVFGATVVSAYGMTECLTGIGYTREELFHRGVRRGSCGRRVFGEIKLLDEQGNSQQDFGELWVRNPTVHPCYLDSDLESGRFREGWFRTKDLFWRDPAGYFFYRGRCDDMFICNGKNVYPAEVERTLLGHPAVDAVCAAPVRRDDGSTLTAVLVRLTQPTSESEIVQFCARNGLSHAVPGIVRFVDDLPQIGAGKMDRIASAKLLQEAYDAVKLGGRSLDSAITQST
jgi:acyl-CoA synthetase (AMP-forming)/AMP-acid ligase II